MKYLSGVGLISKQALFGIKYSFHILFHPFDGFYDLKHEKKGNIYTATLFVVSLILVFILKRQFSGFVINTARAKDLNIISEIVSVLLPLLLWCVSNWCLTTLTEGEGSFKDIYIYSCYSLLPMVLIMAPLILYSRFVTTEEVAFYSFFQSAAFVWAGLLFLFGTIVTHQFTLGKTLFSVIIIIVGIGVIAFIGILFFNIVQQIAGFIREVYLEYILRL